MTTELDELFPDTVPDRIPTAVAEALDDGERLVWVGGPDRWGLFRATPFVTAIALLVGASLFMAAGSGLTPVDYLGRLAGSLGVDPALVAGAAGLVFAGLLVASLRDPREAWTYVVTDRRLMTFHNGRKLRELGPERLGKLRVLQGLEGRLRNVGDVIWARIGSSDSTRSRGPDRGRHGFRGMRDPNNWAQRLVRWGDAVTAIAAQDARRFRQSVADADPSQSNGTDAGELPGVRRLVNERYGFGIAVPARWVGRIGTERRAPARLFGLELPFDTLSRDDEQPLHAAPLEWNYIDVQGRSGMKFTVRILDHPPRERCERVRTRAGDGLIETDDALRCGPLTGFRLDYRDGDRARIRHVMLEGEGFHLVAIFAAPPDRADGLLPAIDAVCDSIDAV